jgi:hypothetical protein
MRGALLVHASERPGEVLERILELAPARLHVMRPYGGHTLWYDREVDDALIAALAANREAPSLVETMDLHEGDARTQRPTVWDGLDTDFETWGPDTNGAGAPPPPVARVSATAWDGDVLEALVEVGELSGSATELAVPGAMRAAGYELLAVVDSVDFKPPDGRGGSSPADDGWSYVFRFPAGGGPTRMEWRFPAKAIGKGPSYRLSVHFSVGGFPVGAARLTVSGNASASVGGELALDVGEEDAPLLVVTREGMDLRARLAGTDLVATLSGVEDLIERLGRDGADPREIGEDLGVSMALFDDVLRRLGDREGARLRISADAPIAPFELIPLDRRKADGPLLGERVAVARHVASASPALSTPFGPGVACLRPRYSGSDARAELPLEEDDLRARYPDMVPCRTEAELDQVLQRTDIGLFHFAGHASGLKGSMLRLESTQIAPTKFRASRPLLSTGRPLFFLNACEAGKAQLSWAAAKNLAHTLIANGARGVVAPVIQVESAAARRAAQVFHRALGEGRTVAQAVCAVRALRAIAGATASTFASYLYFGGLGLRAERPPRP